MLATVLRSKNATEISIAIMRAFVAMRRFLTANAGLFQRVGALEQKQIETENKVDSDFFLFSNTIAAETTHLESLIKGCKIVVDFESDCVLQIYAELLIAFLESLFATAVFKDFMFSTQRIHFLVQKVNGGVNEIVPETHKDEYIFKVNPKTINDKEAWQACSLFLAQLFHRNE